MILSSNSVTYMKSAITLVFNNDSVRSLMAEAVLVSRMHGRVVGHVSLSLIAWGVVGACVFVSSSDNVDSTSCGSPCSWSVRRSCVSYWRTIPHLDRCEWVHSAIVVETYLQWQVGQTYRLRAIRICCPVPPDSVWVIRYAVDLVRV